MFYLGLAIAVASIPGYTSASIPAGWAAMSILLPVTLWREAKLTSLHILFLCFLAWAMLSIAWTPEWRDGVWRVWHLTLIYLAFRLAMTIDDLYPLLRGIATGCIVSSAVAVIQWTSLDNYEVVVNGFRAWPLLQYSPSGESAGLFFNHSVAGQTLALVAVACLAYFLWWHALLLLPGIYLSGSRGAWLILACGAAFWLYRSNKLLATCCGAVLLYVLWQHSSSDSQRLTIWLATLNFPALFGNGAGSFIHLWLLASPGYIVHPMDAHNDLIELLFEYGIGTAYLLLLIGAALTRTARDEWPILASFILLSMFAFPLFTPIGALMFALAAGGACRGWNPTWDSVSISRYALDLWDRLQSSRVGNPRSKAIPIQSGTP